MVVELTWERLTQLAGMLEYLAERHEEPKQCHGDGYTCCCSGTYTKKYLREAGEALKTLSRRV